MIWERSLKSLSVEPRALDWPAQETASAGYDPATNIGSTRTNKDMALTMRLSDAIKESPI